ncbi:hypothetical protein [Desulfosporosinus sp. I2]|uniref:hypothetical protein n=1 Tax=Desulfosporosinus sp. I2 TaxID=1617025 RepID=UPI001A9A4A29|nr:hypothetical protein [Desulfosporosinus sp. I2]
MSRDYLGCWGWTLLETRSLRALAGQTSHSSLPPNRVPVQSDIRVAWPASHILVLSPVFRVAFVKFGGLLALGVHSVSSNVYPRLDGRVFPEGWGGLGC